MYAKFSECITLFPAFNCEFFNCVESQVVGNTRSHPSPENKGDVYTLKRERERVAYFILLDYIYTSNSKVFISSFDDSLLLAVDVKVPEKSLARWLFQSLSSFFFFL